MESERGLCSGNWERRTFNVAEFLVEVIGIDGRVEAEFQPVEGVDWEIEENVSLVFAVPFGVDRPGSTTPRPIDTDSVNSQ